MTGLSLAVIMAFIHVVVYWCKVLKFAAKLIQHKNGTLLNKFDDSDKVNNNAGWLSDVNDL